MSDYEYAAAETSEQANRLAEQGWLRPSDPALAQIPTGWSSSGSTFILRRSRVDLNTALLRRAAEVMRHEQAPFLDAVAALLEVVAKYLPGTENDADTPYVLAVAETYLADPGDLPAAVTGGAQ